MSLRDEVSEAIRRAPSRKWSQGTGTGMTVGGTQPDWQAQADAAIAVVRRLIEALPLPVDSNDERSVRDFRADVLALLDEDVP